MALISQSELEARLGRSLTAEEASAFTLINAALQAHVEKMIGASVEAVEATTRYFDGGVQHLKIGPVMSVTSLTQVDDSNTLIQTYTTSDYVVDPTYKDIKMMIRHRSGPFVNGINNIAVTGKFSIYDDEDMRNIVKDSMLDALVSEIQNTSNISKESIEGYSVEYISSDAKAALSRIKFYFPEII